MKTMRISFVKSLVKMSILGFDKVQLKIKHNATDTRTSERTRIWEQYTTIVIIMS